MEFQNFLKFENVNFGILTNLMKEYYKIKSQYTDFVVLFQVGKFFETYFEDAIELANTTGVAITRRKFKELGSILMAGVPKEKLDIYIERLVCAGYKVVIASEIFFEGKFIRKVTKTYTNGTLLELELLDSKENNHIASIYKDGEKCYFCYSDISVGSVFLTETSLDYIKCELARVSPKELLISKNNDLEKEIYEEYKFELLDEKFFDGIHKNKAYNAILNYAKHILKDCIPQFEKVEKYDVGKNLLMDFSTRKNLELTKNSYNNKKTGSLLWALDFCKTPMGKRLLSSFVSSPLCDIKEIQKRQKTVLNFFDKPHISEKLSALLENIGDMSRLSTHLSNKTATPLELLTLKEGLRLIKEIDELSFELNSPIIDKETKNKSTLLDYYEILDKTIEDNIDELKAGSYIKKGANSDLDVLTYEYKKCLDEIVAIKERMEILLDCKRISITKKAGNYYIEIPNLAKNMESYNLKLVQKLKNTSKYTTDELSKIQEKISSLGFKIEETKKEIFENLKTYSQSLTEDMREYSKKLALLDVLNSFYICAKEYNLVCPTFKEEKEFEVKDGFHIAAKKIFGDFEPFDICFKNSSFIMLTGPNGSGKSTLLKEAGALVVLAQAGCFAPASSAKLSIVDKLYAILNISDEFINQKSSHQAQMKEVSKAIKNSSQKSLILLDEIGKSTSYKEGAAICYGTIRYMLECKPVKCIFTTHFSVLKELLKNFEDKIEYCKITMDKNKRAISKGINLESCGIEIASLENLPKEIIEYAKSIISSDCLN